MTVGNWKDLPHKKTPDWPGFMLRINKVDYFSFFFGALFLTSSLGVSGTGAGAAFTTVLPGVRFFLLLPKDPIVILPRFVLLSPLPMNIFFG